MADGVRFDIAIEATSVGVDATTEQLNAFASRIDSTNRVATSFDKAVAAARTRLDEATAAATSAAAAVAAAEKRYGELEAAANKAAREVEKATAAGKDTGALKAAAETAAAKMREQANAVDELRAKSVAAATAQKQLGQTVKTLEGQQASAAAEIKKGSAKSLETLKSSAVSGKVALLGYATALVGAAGGAAYLARATNPGAMMRLTAATDRAKRGLVQLFAGIKLDKLVGGLEDVMTLFDKGTSSANGMKLLIETIFQPLFDGAAKAAPYVKEMFKGMIYGALQVVIAVLRMRNEILKSLSPETRAGIKKWIDDHATLATAFKVGTGIAIALAAALVVLTVSLIAMAVAELAALWPILLIVAAVAAVIAAFIYWDKIVAWLSETWDAFTAGVKDAAKNLIDGFVNGIKNGVGAVVDALKGLATKGIQAFKDTLGIKSPSKVFALQARYTTEGYVQGLEQSTPHVTSALEAMVEPPDTKGSAAEAGSASTAGSSSSSSKGSRVVQIQQLTVGDSPVAADNWAQLRALFVDLLEGESLAIGGGEAPAT